MRDFKHATCDVKMKHEICMLKNNMRQATIEIKHVIIEVKHE